MKRLAVVVASGLAVGCAPVEPAEVAGPALEISGTDDDGAVFQLCMRARRRRSSTAAINLTIEAYVERTDDGSEPFVVGLERGYDGIRGLSFGNETAFARLGSTAEAMIEAQGRMTAGCEQYELRARVIDGPDEVEAVVEWTATARVVEKDRVDLSLSNIDS